MGTDKALLPYRGKRLVDFMIQLAGDSLRSCFPDQPTEVWVSGDVSGQPCVPDEESGLGPLGGVLSIVRHLDKRSERRNVSLLIVPVDMPLLTPELLATLIRRQFEGVDAIRFAGRELPTLLRITPSVRRAISDLCVSSTAGRQRSFRALLSRLRVEELPLSGPMEALFLNANTPDRWKEVSGL